MANPVSCEVEEEPKLVVALPNSQSLPVHPDWQTQCCTAKSKMPWCEQSRTQSVVLAGSAKLQSVPR